MFWRSATRSIGGLLRWNTPYCNSYGVRTDLDRRLGCLHNHNKTLSTTREPWIDHSRFSRLYANSALYLVHLCSTRDATDSGLLTMTTCPLPLLPCWLYHGVTAQRRGWSYGAATWNESGAGSRESHPTILLEVFQR